MNCNVSHGHMHCITLCARGLNYAQYVETKVKINNKTDNASNTWGQSYTYLISISCDT